MFGEHRGWFASLNPSVERQEIIISWTTYLAAFPLQGKKFLTLSGIQFSGWICAGATAATVALITVEK